MSDIRPLALGNAFRHYLKSRDDTRKLLELHLDPVKDKVVIDRIAETLLEKLYFHDHLVVRKEARDLGLKVVDAESVTVGERRTLADAMWDLYRSYEDDMEFMAPYTDDPPKLTSGKSAKVELLSKLVETRDRSSAYVIEQTWRSLPFPPNSMPSQVVTPQGAIPAIFVPSGNLIPVVCRGQLIPTEGGVFEKVEVSFWKGVDMA